MNHDSPIKPNLTLSLVHEDEHLIELEAHVVRADWAGSARAYTQRSNVRQDAQALAAWISNPADELSITIGSENLGQIMLRFRTIDRRGHIACQVEMQTDKRPSHHWELSLDLETELGLVERFASHLASLADAKTTTATLECPPDQPRCPA